MVKCLPISVEDAGLNLVDEGISLFSLIGYSLYAFVSFPLPACVVRACLLCLPVVPVVRD